MGWSEKATERGSVQEFFSPSFMWHLYVTSHTDQLK